MATKFVGSERVKLKTALAALKSMEDNDVKRADRKPHSRLSETPIFPFGMTELVNAKNTIKARLAELLALT